MKNILNYLLIVILILIAAACVPSKPVKEKKALPPERLIKKLEANRRSIKTFEGTGSLDIRTPQLEAAASFEIFINKPDSIRLDIFGPFGIDLAQILVTRDNFMFYDMMKDKAYTGNVTPDIIKRIFKLEINFNDLIDAFAGSVNLTGQLSSKPDDFQISDEFYYLTYKDHLKNITSKYTVRIFDEAILSYELNNAREKLFENKYQDFKLYDNIVIPNRTVVQNYRDDQALLIEYKKVRLNHELKSLAIELPTDVEVIKW